MKVAVIPARGGSKRIPRKNIKLFVDRPMIAWSIRAAIESQCFDRIIVSTDDTEIAQVAREYGAEAPFFRPPELSNDYMGIIPVIAHAVNWQSQQGAPATDVCCIFATAPFVQAADLRHGLQLLHNTGADYVFSVTSYAFPIQRAVRINADQRVEMFWPEYFGSRSQDLEEAFHDAGQFYWGRVDAWLGHRPIFTSNSVPIILPRDRVQDIDTPEDWKVAQMKFSIFLHYSDNSRD